MHSLDGTEEQDTLSNGDGLESEDNPMDGRGGISPGMDKPYTAEELQPSVLQKMAYDSNFTEDITMRMQIPSKLTVASQRNDDSFHQQNGDILSRMEVPERIVVSMGESGARYGSGQDSSAPSYTEDFAPGGSVAEPVSLATPPRKLTLAERNLDALDVPESQTHSAGNKTDSKSSRVLQAFNDKKSSRLISSKTDSTETKTSAQTSGAGRLACGFTNVIKMGATGRLVPDVQANDSTDEQDDITLMRRQIFKLHRRITAMEKLQTERSKRDYYIYAVSVAFWVLNGWFLYSCRKPY